MLSHAIPVAAFGLKEGFQHSHGDGEIRTNAEVEEFGRVVRNEIVKHGNTQLTILGSFRSHVETDRFLRAQGDESCLVLGDESRNCPMIVTDICSWFDRAQVVYHNPDSSDHPGVIWLLCKSDR